MSRFSETLTEIVQRQERTKRDFGRKSGLTPNDVTAWTNDVRRPKPESLEKILEGIDLHADKAALLIAYLSDYFPESWRNRIRIIVSK